MSSPLPAEFAHRLNHDGTTDSICKNCYLTIATASWEADLDSAERGHKCDPTRLEYLKKAVARSHDREVSTNRVPMKRTLVS
jgi:hypothetical protein